MAVTLCAAQTREPTITPHGDRGSATLRSRRGEHRRVVLGIDELVADAARELATFSELDPRWAVRA